MTEWQWKIVQLTVKLCLEMASVMIANYSEFIVSDIKYTVKLLSEEIISHEEALTLLKENKK
jgi:hypothetical protein